MSLAVWLPLNGDLTNQGLSNVTVTNNGATVDNNGKIGKCYSFGSSKRITISQPTNLSPTQASLSCWVNLSSWASSYDSLINLSTGTGWNDTRLAFVRNNTANRICFCIANGSTYNTVVMTSDLPLNTWTHLTGTFDGNTIKIYVNGILNNSRTTTFNSIVYSNAVLNIGSWSNGNNYPINGKLNDVRLYDHCLSAKEVKELAKGLVLHYRLAGPGQENLVTSLSAGGQTSIDDTYAVHTSKTNADTYFYANLSSSLNPGDKVTVSCDVSGFTSNDYQWNFPFWRQNSGLAFWLKNGHCSQSFIVPSGVSPSNRIIFDDNGAINGFTRGDSIIYIKNFKIERGSVQTPWCPNPADPLYHTMGYDNNIEYDCSGYRRNGIKNGTITWDVDSPRYTTSYSALSDYPIKAEVNMPSCDSMTVSFWTKITTFGVQNSGLFATSNISTDPIDYNDTAMAQRDSDIDLKGVSGSSKIFSFTTPSTGEWHHCVFVYDGSKVYYYQDGKKINEEACAIGALKSYQYFYLGYSKAGRLVRKTLGKWSDLRIYATALSAEDIAELYHSAVIVDNTGKNYAYEYFEA